MTEAEKRINIEPLIIDKRQVMKMDKRKRLVMDAVLIALLLAVTGILYLSFGRTEETGSYAVVRVEGQIVGRYPLSEDRVVPLNGGTNVLAIQDGYAWMQEADCPDHVCMLMGKIHKTGQVITCLPNLLTVTVEGGGDDQVDMIVG